MPLRTASRQCPEATFLPLDTAAYDEASEEVMSLLRDFGHPVEVWGWDEAYVGADLEDPADPIQLAAQIREVVAAETGLSCSVGISDNKQRAKVATGFGKPAGIYQLTDANWMAVMGDRDVDALWGVGPKTAKKLAGLGITTVADLAATDATLLPRRSGRRPVCGSCFWPRVVATRVSAAAVGAAFPQSRHHLPQRPDRARRNRLGRGRSRRQTLAEIVDQGRVVTRVAVTVRTKTFFTRTKIRKLPSAGNDATDFSPRRWTSSTCSNWTARSGCSACDSNSPHPTAATRPADASGAQRPGKNQVAWRIATLYGHHIVRLNMYSARMSASVDQVPVLLDAGAGFCRRRFRRHRVAGEPVHPLAHPPDGHGRRRRSGPSPPTGFSPRRAPPPTPRCGAGRGRSATPRKAAQAVLARAVGRMPGQRHYSGRRGHVDQMAAPAAPQPSAGRTTR